ncbi:MAG: preprotein translocase subunit SecG [Deltaproteobacteria bacterium]|nr:preprotein translocase subunit SecG [Deltaproteobacteria bacterium]
MLTTLVLVIHIIVCVVLILIILLQTGKGADIGAAFGGGSSQTVFGSGGATTFLSKITIAAAVVFMVTSIILTYFADKGFTGRERSIVSERTGVDSSTPAQPIQSDSTQSDESRKPAEASTPGPVEKSPPGPVKGGGEGAKE